MVLASPPTWWLWRAGKIWRNRSRFAVPGILDSFSDVRCFCLCKHVYTYNVISRMFQGLLSVKNIRCVALFCVLDSTNLQVSNKPIPVRTNIDVWWPQWVGHQHVWTCSKGTLPVLHASCTVGNRWIVKQHSSTPHSSLVVAFKWGSHRHSFAKASKKQQQHATTNIMSVAFELEAGHIRKDFT